MILGIYTKTSDATVGGEEVAYIYNLGVIAVISERQQICKYEQNMLWVGCLWC